MYAIIVWAGVSKIGAMPIVMNVFAYLSVLPLNFFFHRTYTFRKMEQNRRQWGRFLVVHALYLSATSGVYVIAGMFHAPLTVGIVGALVMVPLIQFIALDRWVF
jgi:putative flippase GtrA